MGYSLSWVAVRGKSIETDYTQLGVRGTGTRVEETQPQFVGAILPGGWTLVVAEHEDMLVSDEVLHSLSSGCKAIACFIEDHVMVSTAVGWKDARQVWSVTHDGEQGIAHLDAQGDLPSEFAAIRDRAFLKQAQSTQDEAIPRNRFERIIATVLSERKQPESFEVDYIFEVPIDLAEALMGYRNDKEFPGDAETSPFELLESISSKPGTKSGKKR